MTASCEEDIRDLDGMDLVRKWNLPEAGSCHLHRSDWARATSCRMREKVGVVRWLQDSMALASCPVRCSLRIVSGECLSCSWKGVHLPFLFARCERLSISKIDQNPLSVWRFAQIQAFIKVCWPARPGVQILTGRYGMGIWIYDSWGDRVSGAASLAMDWGVGKVSYRRVQVSDTCYTGWLNVWTCECSGGNGGLWFSEFRFWAFVAAKQAWKSCCCGTGFRRLTVLHMYCK